MADELTKALEELRETFPSFDSEITFSTQGTVTIVPWAVDREGAPLAKDVFSAATLNDCMAQVRAWKAAQDAAKE